MTTKDDRAGRSVYRILFNASTDMGAVEDTLLLAILSVGCLHGEAAVRLDAGYAINADERVVVIDASTDIGRSVARIFIGLCTREFGDDNFSLVRADGPLPHRPSAAKRGCGTVA